MPRRQRGQERLNDYVQQTMGLQRGVQEQRPAGFGGRVLWHPSLEVGIALIQL